MSGPQFSPHGLPPQASDALDDLRAYVGTFSTDEALGSLTCVLTNLAMSAVSPAAHDQFAAAHGAKPLSDARRKQHNAVLLASVTMLLDRIADLRDTDPTHDHCHGFLTALGRSEDRILTAIENMPGAGS